MCKNFVKLNICSCGYFQNVSRRTLNSCVAFTAVVCCRLATSNSSDGRTRTSSNSDSWRPTSLPGCGGCADGYLAPKLRRAWTTSPLACQTRTSGRRRWRASQSNRTKGSHVKGVWPSTSTLIILRRHPQPKERRQDAEGGPRARTLNTKTSPVDSGGYRRSLQYSLNSLVVVVFFVSCRDEDAPAPSYLNMLFSPGKFNAIQDKLGYTKDISNYFMKYSVSVVLWTMTQIPSLHCTVGGVGSRAVSFKETNFVGTFCTKETLKLI